MAFLKSWAFWNVVIVIAIVIAGIYLIAVVTSVSFAASLNKKINNRTKGLNSLVVQRHDVILMLINVMQENGIIIPDAITSNIDKEIPQKSITLQHEERDSILLNLSKAFQGLMYLADDNAFIKELPDFIEYKKTITELNEIYRISTAKYNSDASAFNYWISVIGCKWIFKIFKVGKKDLIV